ncbi:MULTISPECIES: VWA domain-containing protein [Micromonospora]|uniref:VWA domain-containing protein n=1 Tax=Micromonospora solifontis TaxID=2487138 RepID=A0ABX9W981_9ACTN|nr:MULTISPECIES: VWA domain-containing protein [Micromonospora]NES17097.1 VWA domain-containing protein [Micromonospora sp. PPF5-17B]NES39393.1 VWA domain-containing protein [Micromonospora solifontis]NES57103.1 VWA domain-containing protein [Micromonospora sp. PPF5-6]RNL89120.1 VWA domain-containing protein [Micromonospora solifontis]
MAGNRFRYGQWRGGPDPLAPPYDVRAAVDAVGAEVLAGGSLREALRDLLRRGPQGRGGLDELAARARRLRREALRRGDLDGAVTRARALLDQALAAEREELRGRDDDGARFAEAVLDNLPRSTARAVEELSGYDWASAEARATYQRILDGLRGEVLEQRFAGLRDAARAAGDPATQRQLAEMMRDLNDLLARHARSEDTTDAFAEFMRRHGEFFPERPKDVDELIDVLARRAAAGERLMRSLSDRQREELAGLMRQSLGEQLAGELSQLDSHLRALRPDLNWQRGERVRGDQPLGYGEATGALGEIAELDELLDQLDQEHPGATLDDVDVDAVARTLGRDAADDVRRLRELERELRRQGWVTRDADGLTLSPKALRRLAGTALRRVFADLTAGPRGQHDLRSAGAAGEVSGASRPWEFGDEQPLDVVRTLTRAVRRAGPSVPVQLAVEDFEVMETERRASAAVALCVDLSYSMISQGRWGPMKQTALALSHLMATRFPQDALQIVGFGLEATTLTQQELAAVEPDLRQGTNLQHALRLAGRHLRRHPGAEPVVLVVTDGEPTAHLDPEDGEAYFHWPPLPETIEATVREVDKLTRYGATLNLFMLGDDPGLRRFVDAVARRSKGRMFTPDLDDLGEYVVSDYLRARRGRR